MESQGLLFSESSVAETGVWLPKELQDYVILHEMVHTKYKNHSKKFWKEIDGLVGDGKRLRREILVEAPYNCKFLVPVLILTAHNPSVGVLL